MKTIYFNYLQGITMIIVATALLIFFSPLFIVYAVIRMAIGMKIAGLLRLINKWLLKIAISFDQLGNVLSEKLFNDILIKKASKHKFGSEDETISSVIGKNQLGKTLTLLGRAINFILHLIDRNHSVDSIE